MNKKIIGIICLLLLLSGCSNVLYKDSRSPIYGSLKDKQQNKVFAYSSKAGNKAPLQIQRNSKNSIERSSSNTIEVKSSNDNPYVDTYSKPTRERVVRPNSVKIKRPNRTSKALSAEKNSDSHAKNISKIKETKKNNKVRDNTSSEKKKVTSKARKQIEKETKTTKVVSNGRYQKTEEKVTQSDSEKSIQSNENKKKVVQKPKKKKVKPRKSAIQSLLKEAHNSVRAGKLDKASAALERAHRIEPSNAKILYDISQIKYAQGKYREADSFASRATNFSKSRSLSKKIWKLLLKARKALGNESGAALAKQKVDNF